MEVVLSLWRTLGVDVPDEHLPMFSERDAEFTSFILQTNPVGSHGEELLRVLGSSLTRVAEAAVAVYVQTVEPEMDVPDVDLGGSGPSRWPTSPRRHCASATRWAPSSRTTCGTPSSASGSPRPAWRDRSLHRLAVGFIDLVGFTPLSLRTSPAKLLETDQPVRGQGVRGGIAVTTAGSSSTSATR